MCLGHLLQGSRRQGKKLAAVARLWARDQLYIPGPGDAHDDPQTEYDDALAAMGLVEDVDESEGDEGAPHQEVVYLWPCNVRTFVIWQQVQTQWRRGHMGVRTGLDYAGVEAWLRCQPGIRPRARSEIMCGIRAMEVAAINVWAEMRAESNRD